MPPRLQIAAHVQRCLNGPSPLRPAPTSLAAAFAALSLSPATPGRQVRHASILASLSDNPGAYNKRIRVGRGASSGYGKTSGRGQKGQKARSTVNAWFQGGQTPLIKIKGRKGFENKRADKLSIVNLDKLQEWIDAGRIDPSKQITVKELIESGLVGTVKDGIKLLARGKTDLRTPINIMVSRASTAAIDAIESSGGRIITRYYTKQTIQRLLKGESISSETPLPYGKENVEAVVNEARANGFPYRLPDPTGRWDIEYYRDPAHRGYLSHVLKEGESPSLFFGVPGTHKRTKKRKAAHERAEDLLF